MAERRMFAKTIIDSDAFTEMPLSSQALYFHLSMRADDDGFLNCAQKIMRMIGAAKNDFDILIAKQFILQLPDGICVIKHWRIHNYLRKDRYVETVYAEQKGLLSIKKNGAYTMQDTAGVPVGIPDGNQRLTQDRLGKDRLGKDSKESADKPHRFTKPTVDEVKEYCIERGNNIDAQQFCDFYEAKGWKVGNQPMRDWKAAARTWERRDATSPKTARQTKRSAKQSYPQHEYTDKQLDALLVDLDETP